MTTPKTRGDRMATAPVDADGRPDARRPAPWDEPWTADQDAVGWETVYRGQSKPREVTSSLVLDLSPEQNEWVDHTAAEAGVTPHAVIKRLIDAARGAGL